MAYARIPPARFGLDRSDPPGQSGHAAVMSWYAAHTNLRVIGGYITGGQAAEWRPLLPADWNAGWGVIVFANTPSGNEWGWYSGTYAGSAFGFDSDSSWWPLNGVALNGSVQQVAASAQVAAVEIKSRMKALFPELRRPVVYLDNEDSNPGALLALNRKLYTIPSVIALTPKGKPAPTAAQQTLFHWLVAHRGAPNDMGQVLKDAAGSTRQPHGIGPAIPWLREAIRALSLPDPDGYAVRPGLYAHTNLVTVLVEEFPELLLCDVNYGGNHLGAPPEAPDAGAPGGPTRTATGGLGLLPGQYNFVPKPQRDPSLPRAAGGSVFHFWPSLVQWVGSNWYQVPNPAAARSVGVTSDSVSVVDYDAALVDDPVTNSPGPRFAISPDGWLWVLERAVATQKSAGLPTITTVRCIDLSAPGAPGRPAVAGALPGGSLRIVPTQRPRPMLLKGRSVALLACQTASAAGTGLAWVERTGPTGALGPMRLSVRPEAGVCPDSPIAIGNDGSLARAVAVGRDGRLRVADLDITNKNPVPWTATGLSADGGGLAVLAQGATTLVAAVTRDGQGQLGLSVASGPPWPPARLTPLPQGSPPVRPMATTHLALRTYLGKPLIMFLATDLRLYYQWQYAPAKWSTPQVVTTEVMSPYTTIAAVEGSSSVDVVTLREDLHLQLYQVTPGPRVGVTKTTLMAPADPLDSQHPTWYTSAPNPFGDLGLARIGDRRIIAAYRLRAPRSIRGTIPDRFGEVVFQEQRTATWQWWDGSRNRWTALPG